MAHRDDTHGGADMPLSSGVDAGPCVAVIVDPLLGSGFASQGLDYGENKTIVHPDYPPVTKHHDLPFFYAGPLLAAENADMDALVEPVLQAQRNGARALVLCGVMQALDSNLSFGELAVLTDQINLLGDSPLIGKRGADGTVAFVNMASAYDSSLIDAALEVACELGTPLRRGVLAACRKEYARAGRVSDLGANFGADTFAPQTLVAVSSGIPVLAVAVVNGTDGVQVELPANSTVAQQYVEAGGRLARLVTAWAQWFASYGELDSSPGTRVIHAEACSCI